MFIDIHDLERTPLVFEEEIAPDAIDLGPDFRQRTPLSARGRAELVEEHHGKHKIIKDIRVQGSIRTRVETSCARCLEPVQNDLDRSFDLLYRPLGTDAGHEELSITDVEAEIGYYEGDGLPLEEILREQVLLAVPLKAVCREDCKGLCPQCGKNLNQGPACSCNQAMEDPRWAALKEIRNKL